MKKKVIFLDRDGTLIEEVDFLSTVDETRLYDFTIEALNLLRDAGYTFVVTTNQSGIARGYFDSAAVNAIHDRISELLNPADLSIEAFKFCPHLPDAGCACRKPGIGMIEQACADLEIDLSGSWVIGDKKLDVVMGYNAGARGALVLTGYGKSHLPDIEPRPDVVGNDLLDAARQIVELV